MTRKYVRSLINQAIYVVIGKYDTPQYYKLIGKPTLIENSFVCIIPTKDFEDLEE